MYFWSSNVVIGGTVQLENNVATYGGESASL